jgi:Flp pilus assembly protein CpaB
MTYRLRNIAIAIALAVLAAMLTSFYVRQQKEDIVEGQRPTAVWVATQDIEAGALGSELSSKLTRLEVAKDAVAPGAIVKPEDVDGMVVTEKIYADEQVSLLRFREPSEQGIRAKLSGNLRAFQIPGDEHQLLVGTIREGDKIDVVGAWKLADGGEQKVSRVVLRDILVLRAPASTEETKRLNADAGKDKSIMLAVTDAQAQKLFWIFTNGEWSLQLRPSDDPADSPEGLEWSGTVLADGLTREQLRRLLVDPFKAERVATP